MSIGHAAIVGGGFSGTLAAIHLLRRGARVTLIERTPRLARGVAYSTRHPEHLLNVRAGSMSAFPDQPDHFAVWLAAREEGDGTTFAQRRTYGRYLEELLAAAAAETDRLTIVQDEAVDLARGDDCEVVRLASGAEVRADAAILSVGNLPPEIPRGIDVAQLGDAYVADPWASDIAAGLRPDDTVFLIGTGLTAIDAALMLDAAGFQGRTVAVSRRGMVPRAHAEMHSPPPRLADVPEPTCSALTRSVRANAAEIGWRAAIDQLRPVTQRLWATAPVMERKRFLRHLRPYWDVHRHRIAPEIAARIEKMEREGRLEFHSGKIAQASKDEVVWRPRGCEREERLAVRRIVNCTGPQGNIARAGEPLLDALVAQSRIRPDPCCIGIDVDERARTLAADGRASDTLLAIGPMTRGAFWEIVAVPDIRVQAAALAGTLAA